MNPVTGYPLGRIAALAGIGTAIGPVIDDLGSSAPVPVLGQREVLTA